MNYLNKLTIKQKIFIYLIGFCSILLLLLWLFQIVFLDSFYKNIKINNLQSNLSKITDSLDQENFSETANEISQENDIYIEIFNKDGVTLFSTNSKENSAISRLHETEKIVLFQKAEENNGAFLQYFSIDKEKNSIEERKQVDKPFFPPRLMENLLSCKIITSKDGEESLLLLSTFIAPVTTTVDTLRVQLYFVTAFMLIFSIILAVLISRKISKPIIDINKSAKELAKGDYETSFSAKGFKEIEELSQTMNYAAQELSRVENLR